MMRRLTVLAVVTGLVVLGAVTYFLRKAPPIYHAQGYVFGTLVDISIYGEDDVNAAKVSAQILQDFQALHVQLHAWKTPKNEIDRIENSPHAGELVAINRAFANQLPVTVSPRMLSILQEVQQLATQSQGRFNPAIGGLISAWGFQRESFSAIDIAPSTLLPWLEAKPDMANIAIDATTMQVKSTNSAVKLDLGGYAKGYALDLALTALKDAGIKHALINIGGNIIALGQRDGKPWRVGIQHPRQPNAIASVDLPSGWAIGTSGDYQRFFTLNGKRYCHILDPRTGYPVQHTQAVTVLVPPQAQHQPQAGVLSDVASKPIFIAEASQKLAFATAMGVADVMVIDAAGQIRVSASMAKKLTWLNADETYRIM